MPRRLPLIALLGALLLGLLAPAGAAPPSVPVPAALPPVDQDPPDCTQIPPDTVPAVPADTSQRQDLRLRVVVERADLALARRHLVDTVEAYRRINIRLVVSWDTPATFQVPTGPGANFPRNLYDALRQRYRGQRPPGTDVVYLFTRQWDGGMADCVGGVLHPDRAFAFGSLDYKTEGVVRPPNSREGVIAAHEIGHLLGAHHHYANCVESVPGAASGDVGCSVMAPATPTATRVFSSLETAFLRDHLARARRGA